MPLIFTPIVDIVKGLQINATTFFIGVRLAKMKAYCWPCITRKATKDRSQVAMILQLMNFINISIN